MLSFTQLGKTDIRILKCLKENARMDISEISGKVFVGQRAVKNSIKKMEQLGIIEGYRPKLNFGKLNRSVACNFLIKMSNRDQVKISKLKGLLKAHADIRNFWTTDGEFNLIIHVLCANIKDYGRLRIEVVDFIGSSECVKSSIIVEDEFNDTNLDYLYSLVKP